MSEEEKLSKYQRKQLAKARGSWVPPAERIEVAITVAASASPITGPVPVNIGGEASSRRLPVRLAQTIAHAAGSLRVAHRLAKELVAELEGKGERMSEPRTLAAMTAAVAMKLEGMANRAKRVALREELAK